MQSGDGLKRSSAGKRVRFTGDGGPKAVIDGPFPETKELIAGLWVWNVASIQEALDWVRRCPDPMPGKESEIEIHPLFRGGGFRQRVHAGTARQGRTIALIEAALRIATEIK